MVSLIKIKALVCFSFICIDWQPPPPPRTRGWGCSHLLCPFPQWQEGMSAFPEFPVLITRPMWLTIPLLHHPPTPCVIADDSIKTSGFRPWLRFTFTQGELLKIPMPKSRPHPGPITSKSPEEGLSQEYFLEFFKWLPCAAKVENH